MSSLPRRASATRPSSAPGAFEHPKILRPRTSGRTLGTRRVSPNKTRGNIGRNPRVLPASCGHGNTHPRTKRRLVDPLAGRGPLRPVAQFNLPAHAPRAVPRADPDRRARRPLAGIRDRGMAPSPAPRHRRPARRLSFPQEGSTPTKPNPRPLPPCHARAVRTRVQVTVRAPVWRRGDRCRALGGIAGHSWDLRGAPAGLGAGGEPALRDERRGGNPCRSRFAQRCSEPTADRAHLAGAGMAFPAAGEGGMGRGHGFGGTAHGSVRRVAGKASSRPRHPPQRLRPLRVAGPPRRRALDEPGSDFDRIAMGCQRADTAMNAPSDTSDSPLSLLPQQSIVPPTLRPQLWSVPAEIAAKTPSGTFAWAP